MATTDQVATWRRVIAEQERGDETQGEFCARRGLRLETFRNWKYRRAHGKGASRAAPMGFVRLNLVDRAAGTASGIEIALGGDRVVRVARGFDGETLKRLLEVLEARSC